MMTTLANAHFSPSSSAGPDSCPCRRSSLPPAQPQLSHSHCCQSKPLPSRLSWPSSCPGASASRHDQSAFQMHSSVTITAVYVGCLTDAPGPAATRARHCGLMTSPVAARITSAHRVHCRHAPCTQRRYRAGSWCLECRCGTITLRPAPCCCSGPTQHEHITSVCHRCFHDRSDLSDTDITQSLLGDSGPGNLCHKRLHWHILVRPTPPQLPSVSRRCTKCTHAPREWTCTH